MAFKMTIDSSSPAQGLRATGIVNQLDKQIMRLRYPPFVSVAFVATVVVAIGACRSFDPEIIPRYQSDRNVEGLLSLIRLPRNPPPDFNEKQFLPGVYALRRIGPDAVPVLLSHLGHRVLLDPKPLTREWDEELTRQNAIEVLKDMGDERALASLLAMLDAYLVPEDVVMSGTPVHTILLAVSAINNGAAVVPLRTLCDRYAYRNRGSHGYDASLLCGAADDIEASQRCRVAAECKTEGRCAAGYLANSSPCVAISDAACRRSRACAEQGLCFLQPGRDACAREPLWAAPEAEELPAEFPFKATYQADEIQRRLCLEYEPRGAAGKFEEGYCAENARARKRVAEAAWLQFLGFRKRHRTLDAGQSIWLQHAGQSVALWQALSGPNPRDEPEPLRLVLDELHRRRRELGDHDKLGFLDASAARKNLPVAEISCLVSSDHAASYVAREGGQGKVGREGEARVTPSGQPGLVTLSVTRGVCDCASRRRQCAGDSPAPTQPMGR
jgi:hypothetical protein